MGDDESARQTLAQWLDEHGDYLFRFACFQVRDDAAAEDLVQDTLLAAFSAKRDFRQHASVRTWLTAILKNKIVDHFRRVRREIPAGSVIESETEEDATATLFDERGHWRSRPLDTKDPALALEDKQFWRALSECLAGLSPVQAEAFVLAELHELTTAEVCKVLQLKPSNVWVVLHRARTRLRLCLENRWLRGR